MNRYRRNPQTHAAKTAHLSLADEGMDARGRATHGAVAEEGAYNRLLDWQYSNEAPLPSTPQERWRITRAITAGERRATDKIAAVFFHESGWQPHAREEIEGDCRDPGGQLRPEIAISDELARAVVAAVTEPEAASTPAAPQTQTLATQLQAAQPTPPPNPIPQAITDLGLKLLAAPGIPVEKTQTFLHTLCDTMGQDRGFDLLRRCERERIVDPVAWLNRTMDANEASHPRAALAAQRQL